MSKVYLNQWQQLKTSSETSQWALICLINYLQTKYLNILLVLSTLSSYVNLTYLIQERKEENANKLIFYEEKNIAERGFDPPTFELWAQRDTTTPPC